MNSLYDIEGKVKLILPLQTFASGFSKRELVITTADDRYPQDIKLEATRDKIDLLESLKENDPIKVKFSIRGNEYNGKYFVNLSIINISRAGKGLIDEETKKEEKNNNNLDDIKFVEEEEDLPF